MREAVFYPFTLKAYLMASTKVGFVRELRHFSGEASQIRRIQKFFPVAYTR
jgi:hypothetical protein